MNSFALFSSKATSAARALVPLGSHRQGGRFPKLPISLFPLGVPHLIKGCVTVMDFTRFPEDGWRWEAGIRLPWLPGPLLCSVPTLPACKGGRPPPRVTLPDLA